MIFLVKTSWHHVLQIQSINVLLQAHMIKHLISKISKNIPFANFIGQSCPRAKRFNWSGLNNQDNSGFGWTIVKVPGSNASRFLSWFFLGNFKHTIPMLQFFCYYSIAISSNDFYQTQEVGGLMSRLSTKQFTFSSFSFRCKT